MPPPVELPVVYDEHRWLVAPLAKSGERLLFYTDSGGGMNMLLAPVAGRLELVPEPAEVDGQKIGLVAWQELFPGSPVPPPQPAAPFGGKISVLPWEERIRDFHPPDTSGQPRDAGFLGSYWFADRAWTFDYPGRRLFLRSPGDLPPHVPEHRAPLGFQTGPNGKRTSHFPRLQAIVDGETLDLLFDTGATTRLTPSALAAIGDGKPADRAASFIIASIFERWRQKHPGWWVIEQADQFTNEAMIEVPEVSLGGHTIGPVWFTRRKDTNFTEYISQWMDRPIVGALGGSAFRYLRVTADYPGGLAVFEKP